MDDASLASACQSGDLHGFERLYHLHASRMKSVARNLLGSSSEAEDAVQDAFLKIQRSVASFRGQSSFATWSFRILSTLVTTRAAAVCAKKKWLTMSRATRPRGLNH